MELELEPAHCWLGNWTIEKSDGASSKISLVSIVPKSKLTAVSEIFVASCDVAERQKADHCVCPHDGGQARTVGHLRANRGF